MRSDLGFVIGVDGGASKTAAIIVSEDGDTIISRRAPPSAIVGRPHAEAISVLATLLQNLAEDAGTSLSSVRKVVLGLSGIDYEDDLPQQNRDLIEGLGLARDQLVLVNDSIVALAGATTTARSTVVQHGTEVTLAYRSTPGDERVFDSLGVAACFDIRHKAVPLVARMIDGRAAATSLRDAVLAHCDVSADRFAEWYLRSSDAPGRVLTLAPVIFGQWLSGDPAAQRLVESAVEDYAIATMAMARRMNAPGPFAACFGGGTLELGGPALLVAIAERLDQVCPDARLVKPAYAPEVGAALLGLHKLGRPADSFLESLGARALGPADTKAPN